LYNANILRLLSVKVVAEAEEKPKPISDVNSPQFPLQLVLTSEVPRCGPSPSYGRQY